MYINENEMKPATLMVALRRLEQLAESDDEGRGIARAIAVVLTVWPRAGMHATALETNADLDRVVVLPRTPGKDGMLCRVTSYGDVAEVEDK